MTPKDRAQRAADAMWRNDRASPWFGMALAHVDAGVATLTLDVGAQHCNGMDICHGGVTFALADSAFAFACNSYNTRAVAQHNTISYLAPAKLGDRLTAEATEVQVTGRTGIYDVRVTTQDGVTVATFRGVSRSIGGVHFEETP